ncbi:MAG: membrane protein [Rhodomicrobium sp.]|nr:MAG: membrane protein [Rhodomicrobium sp.]
MTDALFWLVLTALLTTLQTLPYVIERIFRVGFFIALKHNPDSGHANSDQPLEKIPHWAKRAYRGHKNSVDNLIIFAILIITAHLIGKTDSIIATSAMVYFYARLVHYIVYIFAVPVVRTLVFFVGLGAIFTIAYQLFM